MVDLNYKIVFYRHSKMKSQYFMFAKIFNICVATQYIVNQTLFMVHEYIPNFFSGSRDMQESSGSHQLQVTIIITFLYTLDKNNNC